MNLIETHLLSKKYPDIVALDAVTLSLAKGEILGLLGPNGAGKTTLIHIMMGLLSPSSGLIKVLGLSPLTDRATIAQQINFSSAYASLPSNLTIIENLNLFARLYNVPNRKQKVAALLEEFELTTFTKRLTGALSAGEKTRLNLCKAFLNDPVLLLLDEPTASLDPEMADDVRRILRERQARDQVGIIYTSHNMDEVTELCHRLVFINHGRIIAEGTPSEVLTRFKSDSLDEVFIHLVRRGHSA